MITCTNVSVYTLCLVLFRWGWITRKIKLFEEHKVFRKEGNESNIKSHAQGDKA